MPGAFVVGVSIVAVVWSCKQQSFFTIFLCGVLVKLSVVPPFAVILFGQFVPSSLPEGYYLLVILFSCKSKQCVFNYLFPCEEERTAYKCHNFFCCRIGQKEPGILYEKK